MLERAVVLTALLLARARLGSSTPNLDWSNNPPNDGVLSKTVASSRMRLVFAVGLEGAGHAYVLRVADNFFKENPEISRLDGENPIAFGKYHIPWLLNESPDHFASDIAEGRRQMRKLKEREDSLGDDNPGTVVVMHGKYSYPNGLGPDKVFQYMDLRLLAEAAEAEGVDFRVLYLRRSARDLMLADTVHRNFQLMMNGPHNRAKVSTDSPAGQGYFMKYIQVLFTNAAVVHSFLGEIDPGFVVCHDFDRLGDADQALRISEVLAPNERLREPLAHSFVAAAVTKRTHSSETLEPLPYPSEDLLAARLQDKLDAFEPSLCL